MKEESVRTIRFIISGGILFILAATAPALEAQTTGSDYEIGLTLYQLDRLDRALPYLERAAQADPDSARVAIPLGISLSRMERHQEAVDILSTIPLEGEAGSTAAYYLARSYRSLGDVRAARRAYTHSFELDGPLSQRALLEAGQLALSSGNLGEAQRNFSRILELEAAAELTAEAELGLQEVRRRREQRRFRVSARTGLRYDSNVPMLVSPEPEDSGFRTELNIQARYHTWEQGPWRSDAAINISQGRFLTPQHRRFDLGIHQARTNLQYKPATLPLRFSIQGAGDYFTQDFTFYRYGLGGGPQVTASIGKKLATVLAWNWRRDNYKNDDRDGVNRRTQLTQFVFWRDKGYAGLGGIYEQNRPQSEQWTYDQIVLRTFAGDEVIGGVLLDASVDYILTPYLNQPVPRSSNTVSFSAGLGRNWGPWGFRLSGARMINQGLFPDQTALTVAEDFAKTMVALDLRARF